MRKKTMKIHKTAQQIHDEELTQRIREAWAILERLVNQNIYDDIGILILPTSVQIRSLLRRRPRSPKMVLLWVF